MASTEEEESKILVDLVLPEGYKKVEAGKSILIQTEIILLEKEPSGAVIDILIEYAIKNSDGIAVVNISETKGIRERISTVKELAIPTDALPGTYTIEVKANYFGKIAMDAVSFEVIRSDILQTISRQRYFGISLLALLIMILLLSVWNFRKFNAFEEKYKKIDERDLKKDYII